MKENGRSRPVSRGLLPVSSPDQGTWTSTDNSAGCVLNLGSWCPRLPVTERNAVIAVGGEFGTLSEIAFALKLSRRVVGLSTWELPRRPDPIPAPAPPRRQSGWPWNG